MLPLGTDLPTQTFAPRLRRAIKPPLSEFVARTTRLSSVGHNEDGTARSGLTIHDASHTTFQSLHLGSI